LTSVLVFTDHYLPGYKGGGPARTLSNLVNQLGNEFNFKIITADRDRGESESYAELDAESWQTSYGAEVFYISSDNPSLRKLRSVIRNTAYDLIYLNSFFSPTFTIKPLLLWRLRLIPRKPVILAPRGEFSPGALTLKKYKKRAYLALVRLAGIYQDVIWQASSEYEKKDIHRWFGSKVPIMIAPNLPSPTLDHEPHRVDKPVGELRVVFLSRISRMKNLDGALDMLRELKGKVQFNIYGPLEGKDYWVKCQKLITTLSPNIQVEYKGPVPPERVADVLADHDLLLLPTLGENFGHVILESLLAGCPVLVSDRTPWRGLQEKGVGWDLPLEQPERFRAALQRCVDMGAQEHREWSHRAFEFGMQRVHQQSVLEQNRALFKCTLVRA
jgi:glycosyltransferase involved in cell wall biosynthesis